MLLLWSVLAAGFGAVVGLLVPRVVYRLAVGPEEPWRGHCPAGHALTGPAGGWLGWPWCGGCPRSYGSGGVTALWRPGAVFFGAAGAVVCGVLAAGVGPRPELAVWLLLVPVGLVLTVVDRAVNRLPDVVTLPLAAATALLLGVAALLPGAAGSWPRALLGGAALAGTYGVLFLINPRGMGFGDVKLALGLGMALGWYGWGVLLVGAFLGFLFGALYGMVLVLRRRARRGTEMAFGPFMILGALLGVILGGMAA